PPLVLPERISEAETTPRLELVIVLDAGDPTRADQSREQLARGLRRDQPNVQSLGGVGRPGGAHCPLTRDSTRTAAELNEQWFPPTGGLQRAEARNHRPKERPPLLDGRRRHRPN